VAHGLADNVLTEAVLAHVGPVVVAPAMNTRMWANAATQANVATLRARGVRVLGPGVGDQACGEVGEGRMLEAAEIAAALYGPAFATPADAIAPATRAVLAGRHVVITAGPTREALDPVRFISNRSSGKMGYAIAQAAHEAGARVTLVSGPVNLATPPGVTRVDVESAEQMHAAVHAAIVDPAGDADVYIGAAAVADYTPTCCAERKIKKSADSLDLHLTRAKDILASVAALERRPFTVGFAAETNDVEKHARDKLVRKRLDLIAANEVGAHKAFDRDDNALLVLWNGGRRELALKSKADLAREFVALVAERYAGARVSAAAGVSGTAAAVGATR
jgi:phosphopantothenoylcysteine decarboxylase/phosphopantothenate--cysteine ligase